MCPFSRPNRIANDRNGWKADISVGYRALRQCRTLLPARSLIGNCIAGCPIELIDAPAILLG